jgi:predicted PurR-regulated permease PerM
MARLWAAADKRGVPLRTIVVTVLVVAAFFLAGELIYRLRDVMLLVFVAGFLALLLNPLVVALQRHVVARRGFAVIIVAALALLAFAGLAFTFGYPLANAITNLVSKLHIYVANAQHGTGWIGHLVRHYHVEQWVQHNSQKLVSFGQSLSAPALQFGKGAFNLAIELLTIFILVLLLLLEGPKLRSGVLKLMKPSVAADVSAVSAEVSRAVTGYMLGNLLTSLIAGVVVLITLMIVGVPFALLWALWVALVDFLPMIGGALAGIPTVAFAFFQSTTAGVTTLVVFLIYTQIENHVLNPVIMSRTVKISPLLVLMSVLVGASVGSWIGGIFGGFVAALLSIPVAGAAQVIVREFWRVTAPPQPPPREEAPEPAVADDGEKLRA